MGMEWYPYKRGKKRRNKPKYHSEVFRCLSLSLNLLCLEVNSLTPRLFRKTNDLFTKVSGSTIVLVTSCHIPG